MLLQVRQILVIDEAAAGTYSHDQVGSVAQR